MVKKLFISLFALLLFVSCESESNSIELDPSLTTRTFFSSTEYNLFGTTSIDGNVEVYLNDTLENSFATKNRSFSYFQNFANKGSFNLSLVLKDSSGKILAEYQHTLSVIDTNDLFSFHYPEYVGSQKNILWATYYYLPQVRTVENGYPLLDGNGKPLGPILSRVDWCNSAMEGSVFVLDDNNSGVTYNYFSETGPSQVDCSDMFDIDVSTTRFRLANGQYGDGVEDYKLIPYRTIAVDPNKFSYGSVIYVPAARGNKIILPDGNVTYHDGYFFAGDTGRAIIGKHIDVYIGVADENPFDWVTSYEDQTFEAYKVTDQAIINLLKAIHK